MWLDGAQDAQRNGQREGWNRERRGQGEGHRAEKLAGGCGEGYLYNEQAGRSCPRGVGRRAGVGWDGGVSG